MPTGADRARYSELSATGCCESFILDNNGLFDVVITPADLMADLILDCWCLLFELSLRKRCCSILLILNPLTSFMGHFIDLEIRVELLLQVQTLSDSLIILLIELGISVA